MKKNRHFELTKDSSKYPLVTILLCTYNGANYLKSQLDSIESQNYQNWVLFASDDGSTDATLEILKNYKTKWPEGRLTIVSGPKKGFSQNFLSLACNPHIKGEYFAFSDQDDIWLDNKLSVAVKNIMTYEVKENPYLYCGRTIYYNEVKKIIGKSPLFNFLGSFRNALVQSLAGGNTMVFNNASKLLLEYVGETKVSSHDWWTYQIITGVGGSIYYDPIPQILYRQHKGAIVGGNKTFMAQVRRVKMLFGNRFKIWNNENIKELNRIRHLLLEENRKILDIFIIMRTASVLDKLRLMGVAGLYRQTLRGTVGLYIACLFNKI